MIALIAAVLAAAADPCAPVADAGARDPGTAALYREVGDSERAKGSTDTAVVAYQAALALDPSDDRSRRALADLCAAARLPEDPFQLGLARMNSGDLPGAIAAFRDARSRGPDASAALLEGVCEYELGSYRAARVLLREAAEAPVHREAADLYLGLIAMREGDASTAARLLDAASLNPGFATIASDLARVARRSGKLVLSVLGESGWDSNAALAPDGTPLSSSQDGAFGVSALGVFRPAGESGPYLRAGGLYRQQLRFTDLDYGGVSAAAGWQLGARRSGALAEYNFDYRLLAGSSFLVAHRLLAAAWVPAGRVILGASYFARFESYPAALYAPYSGTYQRAEASATVPLGPAASLVLGYHLGVDGVERRELSWIEHGPAAELRLGIVSRLRFTAAAALSLRGYDALDPTLAVQRSDAYLDLAGVAEWDLGDHWTARLALEARKAFSNAPTFEYFRLAPVLGIAYVIGM